MAAQGVQEPASYTPPAEIVGNAFARQYYQILEQSPALVYRFYQDMSKLGRPEENGAMGSATTMEAINEKIQSYGSLKAEVKFVDAQESYNGGVIVLVIGSMINVGGSRRAFTQTFFLAPQDKGYYVLNDIFRYLEEDCDHSVNQDTSIAPATPTQVETPPVEENHVSEQSNGEVYDPPDGEVAVDEEEVVEEEGDPVAEVVDEAPHEPQVVVESNVKVEEVPKKSYASIVMKDTPVTAASPVLPPKSVPRTQEQQLPTAPTPPLVPIPPPCAADNVDENNQEREGDGHSIYLRNLPINITYELVEENFKRFGPIKHGGIQIRNNKVFCFGFVEFEVSDAVRSAKEASPILIGGREVVVEEKRSTSSRGSSSVGINRGRYPPGRGGGYRGEGGRGRGSYGGGRGYGRGDSNNKNDFGNRGSGRGFQNRNSEGYQRSDHAGNGTGRMNRGVGPGILSARAQRISA